MTRMTTSASRTWKWAGTVVLIATAMWLAGRSGADVVAARADRADQANPARQGVVTAARRDFVRGLRLSGTVEAIQSTTIAAPRLSGPNTQSLVVTRLVRPGSTVQAGDLIVEFDRQQQLTNALDKRAELADLEQQIKKREAQERAAAAKDDSEIKVAESTEKRAELEMVKNDMIAKIEAEKNVNALEQAKATLKQLQTTYDLKRKAAEADIRMLRIRRDRADNAMKMAETNASRMAITAPIAGMVVIKTIWKSGNQAEIQEGEEIRAGVPVADIVNPNAMRVRARVNQADVNDMRLNQSVRVGLDAYPDLQFGGTVAQISPLGVISTLSPKVRTFIVLINVDGAHPKLMPDLTASLDVELSRQPRVLVIPRDSVRRDGDRSLVSVQRGSGFEDREVKLGALNAHEVVVESGLEEGAVVARNVQSRASR
jgi:HlyD family secretion protein